MGFSASGWVSVTVTKEIEAQINSRGPAALSARGYDSIGQPVIPAALEWCEISSADEPPQPYEMPNGQRMYSGRFEGRWSIDVGGVLAVLASLGAQVTASFFGEQGDTWAYRSALGGSPMQTGHLVFQDELDSLTAARAGLEQVREMLAQPESDFELERLMTLLRDITATQSTNESATEPGSQ
jgi:hypothetical protein